MPHSLRLSLALPCLLAIAVAACNAPTPSVSTAAVTQTSALADDSRGDGYEYHIRYPELAPEWSALSIALHAYADERKRLFAASLPPPAEHAANAAPAILDLEFNVARRTEAFISVLAQGTVHAEGRIDPLAASFVLHPGDTRLLAITDLFDEPAKALQALSSECQRQLEGRYEASLRQTTGDGKTLAAALKSMQDGVAHGTAPDAANFAVFLVDGIDSKAIGLTLFFAQAQLAMGSGGEQQVEVPAKVFYELLKPAYRDEFSVDVKEIATGVR